MGDIQGDGRSCLSNDWRNIYHMMPQYLERLGIHTPPKNRIFVANLDYTIEKKKLKEVFMLAGEIVRIEMLLDEECRSRGLAVIEYAHPIQALQAVSMFHNQMLYTRAMTVRMDRIPDNEKLPDLLESIGMGFGDNGKPLKDIPRSWPFANNCNQ